MEIFWYGLSCFRMVERGSIAIVTDPYDHNSCGYSQLKLKADVVTVSHDAPGHANISAVKGDPYIIAGPGEYEIGGVFITGVRTNGRKRNSDEPYNTLYLFNFDEVSIVHLGDLQRVPSQAEVEALGQVNIALVPVGDGINWNAAKAAEIISLLEPGIVIPMHYATPETTLKLQPLNRFLKEMGVDKVTTEPSLKVERGRIPDETRVVVLESRK
jgi:L-ascorbate metabolism protein UlaG (beta-lactamase superfamily)